MSTKAKTEIDLTGSAGGLRSEPGGRAGVPGMALRPEVRVLSWSPDRGNPTLMRQGRGPELTGRFAGGWLCRRGSVRACLEEAVGALWSRTRVKRRKAVFGGRVGPWQRCPVPVGAGGRIGDVITTKSQRLTPGDLLGPEVR